VRLYDLAKDRVSRMRLPTLEMLSKSFAARFTKSLSSLLARELSVEFDGLSNAKVNQILASLPSPTSIASVSLRPLPGAALVKMEAMVLLGLMEAFYGGNNRASNEGQSITSSAAQRFLTILIRSAGPEWSAAWAPVVALEFDLQKIESNPRFLQIGGPQDILIVAKFVVSLGSISGSIEFLIPETMLAPVREALAADSAATSAQPHVAWAPVLAASLQLAKIETRAVLTEAKISLGELVKLVPGDVIPIEAPDHVTLLAGDVPLYTGRFGVSQGYNALRVISGVSHEQ
jgi:flagellar motor switch protein FliM